jgi:hypothetical protein
MIQMNKAMSDIRYFYHKQIKELKESNMEEKHYLKYISEGNKELPKSDRSTIKEGTIGKDDTDYHKNIVSDLNAVLASARNGLHAFEAELQYDADSAKALQDSINNIQEYKDKLISQYTK